MPLVFLVNVCLLLKNLSLSVYMIYTISVYILYYTHVYEILKKLYICIYTLYMKFEYNVYEVYIYMLYIHFFYISYIYI